MSIFAEDIEKGTAFIQGLFKFSPEEKFNQAVLALTSDAILVYNDNAPDSINGENWMYSVKVRLPKETVSLVINEIIMTKSRQLQGLNRLCIEIKGVEKPYYFYYAVDFEKEASNFIAGLKHYGYRADTRKNKLGL